MHDLMECLSETGDAARRLFIIRMKEEATTIWRDAEKHSSCQIHEIYPSDIGLPADRTWHSTAASMAAIIRAIQPHGPYRLAGLSPYGPLACEVASFLLGEDQAVPFLCVLGQDHHAPKDWLPAPSLAIRRLIPNRASGVEAVSTQLKHWWTRKASHTASDCSETTLLSAEHSSELIRELLEAEDSAADATWRHPELEYRSDFLIQVGRTGHAPLFCVPGAGDSVMGFSYLATALGSAWPIHGFQPRGLDGEMVPHSTVQAAAANHVRVIEALYPDGPIHLLGHSFGGWIAYDMAGRLRASARTVASLTLVDSEAPDSEDIVDKPHTELDVFFKLIEIVELSAQQPLGIDQNALGLLDQAGRLSLLHSSMVRTGLMPVRSKPAVLTGCFNTFAAALRTVYHPKSLPACPMRLVLVSNTQMTWPENERAHRQMLMRWRTLAPDLSFWLGPGNHMTVLRPPHVAALAEWWLSQTAQRASHIFEPRGLPAANA